MSRLGLGSEMGSMYGRLLLQSYLRVPTSHGTHMAQVTVLYFAGASTATGQYEETVTLPTTPFPLSSLASHLNSLHPGTGLDKVLTTSQWSVDAVMVHEPETCHLKGGEEVAVIPPVSGG